MNDMVSGVYYHQEEDLFFKIEILFIIVSHKNMRSKSGGAFFLDK